MGCTTTAEKSNAKRLAARGSRCCDLLLLNGQQDAVNEETTVETIDDDSGVRNIGVRHGKDRKETFFVWFAHEGSEQLDDALLDLPGQFVVFVVGHLQDDVTLEFLSLKDRKHDLLDAVSAKQLELNLEELTELGDAGHAEYHAVLHVSVRIGDE